MKKLLAGILISIMVLALVGCSKSENKDTKNEETETQTQTKNNTESSDTLGNTLAAIFEEEISKSNDIETIANRMVSVPKFMCGATKVEEGSLTGFSKEVTGFKKAYKVSSTINTIPFVAYIFDTDDPDALQKTLTTLANPRWNICTRAEETVIKVHEKYVFFAMCPGKE